ncbi:MAG: YIP1 family protein [Bryobacterales bacterium]|nr:YIP1 family protein [Bryobacterales bacterium]
MSEIGRLTGVIANPVAAFTDIAARPRWWVPALLVILVQLSFIHAYSTHVGWEGLIRHQIESNSRMQQLPAEQVERIIEQQSKFGAVAGYASALLGPILMTLVAAALFKGLFSILDASMPFKAAYAATWYALLPGALSAVLAIGVMYGKDPVDFDIRNPLAFNAGAYLDKDSTATFVHSLATSFDLFSIWLVILLGIGYAAASRMKVTTGKSIGLVAIIWTILVLVKAGLASIF